MSNLREYTIDVEKCTGCTICAKKMSYQCNYWRSQTASFYYTRQMYKLRHLRRGLQFRSRNGQLIKGVNEIKPEIMNLTIEVNNNIITANPGDTILDALTQNGMSVPTLCHMKGLFPTGACRMCVVEVEGRKNLVTACSEPVVEGMKIKTHSGRVIESRKTIVELLLSNHPDDCLYCERNGSCELQDLSEDLHIRERRVSGQKQYNSMFQCSIVRDPANVFFAGVVCVYAKR